VLLKEYGKAKGRLVRAMGLEPAHNAASESNGEHALLRLLASLPEISGYDTVIDVGANQGEWTAAAIERLAPRGIRQFYCVEPIPSFAANIKSRFAARGGINVVERILSHSTGGDAEIFEAGGGGRMYRDYRGSEVTASSTKKIVSHKVPVSTGDDVFGELSIKPYLVKIDCDGHDLHVLRGFTRTLRDRRPLVQFEYSDFWIGAGSRLRDACTLLAEAGYDTFKVFPDRLEKFRFNRLFETFGYQNIFAAPREFRSLSGKTISLQNG
jgi:FkbM family methyltransferase